MNTRLEKANSDAAIAMMADTMPTTFRRGQTVREIAFDHWQLGNADLEHALEALIDAGALCGRVRRHWNRPWTIEGRNGQGGDDLRVRAAVERSQKTIAEISSHGPISSP